MDETPSWEEQRCPEFDRHIVAAEGFALLGRFIDANAELEKIEPRLRSRSEVLVVCAEIYRALGRWELLEMVSKTLVSRDPTQDSHIVDWVLATRMCRSLEAALRVLRDIVSKYPSRDFLRLELARYECEAGNLAAAKEHHAEVLSREPSYGVLITDEPLFIHMLKTDGL